MKHLFFVVLVSMGLINTACKEKATPEEKTEETQSTTSDISGTYAIDKQASEIKWRGFKPTGIHNGIVPVGSGTVTVSNGNVTGGTVEIDMSGITVLDQEGENKAKLEAHLKGTDPGKEEDFFNVDKYPTATYVINSVTPLDNDPDGTHMVNGTLTIKNISKPSNFKARITIDPNKLTVVTPEFDVDRTEYDIRFKSRKFFNNLADDFVNDEFKLQLNVVADKQ